MRQACWGRESARKFGGRRSLRALPAKKKEIRDLCEVPHIASAAPAPILVLREG
jgi:hypothetical protein